MARKTRQSATSLVLVLVLAFQAGCATVAGPPAPLRPDDPVQVRALERAPAVNVFTVDHKVIRLNRAEMAGPYLLGWEWRPMRSQKTLIRLESIAAVQPYKTRANWVGPALVTALVIAVTGGLFWLLVPSTCGDTLPRREGPGDVLGPEDVPWFLWN